MLPREFPAFPLVYYYFRRWQADGRWARLNQALVRRHRQQAAHQGLIESGPSVAVLDAQSVKCSERGVLDKGFDGHKKSQGRKRQLLVAAACSWPFMSGRPNKTTGSAARKP